MNLGILKNLPIADYHAADCVSSTRLMDLRPSPQYYHMLHVAHTLARLKPKEFDIGNAAHWLILEGRAALEARTVLQPATYPASTTPLKGTPNIKGTITENRPWTYAANYCKDWRAAQAGKVILTATDFATIDKMAAAVGENPDAMALLSGGESEVTFRVQHPAFSVQCRADHWHGGVRPFVPIHPTCVDLKTCDSIEQFRTHYFQHRYYYRAAFYQDVIADAVGKAGGWPAFRFVVVEKNPPWRCEVYEPSESDLELGRNEMLADLQTLRTCIETSTWPNSRLGVQTIELSSWQRKLSEDRGAGLFEEAAL